MLIPFNIFLILINILKLSSRIAENEIYYETPSFNIRNTNVTIASNLRIGAIRNESLEAIAESLTSICQAVLINQKAANVSIDGIINLAFQEYTDWISSGQEAIMSLLSNNFYYSKNGIKVSKRNNFDIAGFLTNSNYGTAKINSLPLNDYGIPSISAGDLGRGNPDNQFSGQFPAMNRSFAQVMSTFDYNSFDAVLDILKYFNWTLVGNLYQANTYGYNRQQSVLDYASKNSVPNFACNIIFGLELSLNNTEAEKVLDDFCFCVTDKAIINVIVLWMSTSAALPAITILRRRCSAAKKWTFIITDDFQTPQNILANNEAFQYSLLVRNNGPWSYKDFLKNCKNNLPENVKPTIDVILKNFYKLYYGCELEPPANETLPQCVQNFFNRTERCICTLDETEEDPYTSKAFFTADIINVYAEAIKLLQNNCTFLNSKRYNLPDLPDYCAITTFTPTDLSFAARYVNFTGYTGQIWFSEAVFIRSIKPFYLFSAYNDSTLDAVLVGYMSNSSVEIDVSKVRFINGKVPASRIIPQNLNLSYAIVDVFFGISIAEVFISVCLIVFIFLHRNYRAIRQNAPWLTLAMLIGVLWMSISQLLLSFSRTDGMCYITLYFTRFGTMLLLMGLLVKNYRIYKIFSNNKATALSITEGRLLWFLVIFMFIYMAIVVALTISLDYGAYLKQSTKNQYYQYVQCCIPNSAWNKIVELYLLITLAIPVLASLILAWLTRKVRSEYRESSTLAAFSIVITISLLIFIPLSVTLSDESNSEALKYAVFVEYFSVVIFSAFGLLFFPKVYSVLKAKARMRRNRPQN